METDKKPEPELLSIAGPGDTKEEEEKVSKEHQQQQRQAQAEDTELEPPKAKKPKKVKDKEKIRQRKKERKKKLSAVTEEKEEGHNSSEQKEQQQQQRQAEAAVSNPFQAYIDGEKSTNDFRELVDENTVFEDFFAANAEEALHLKAPNIRNFLKWLFVPEEYSVQNRNFCWKHPVPPKFSRVVFIAANSFPAYLTEGMDDLFIKKHFPASCKVASPGDKIRIYPTMDALFLDSSKSNNNNNNNNQQQQQEQQHQCESQNHKQLEPENLLEEGKPWWAHAEDLLLTDLQLSELGFPVAASTEEGILATEPAESLPLAEGRAIMGLDCEMCQTAAGLEVTRISIVDSNFVKIYDEFVLPRNTVTDYLTQYSGITANTLKDVHKTFEEARRDVLSIVHAETILVGHSLENDLRKLSIAHRRVIDTVVLYPHRNGGQSKNKLSWIAEVFLGKKIHVPGVSHDSTEDAYIALELVKHRLTVGEPYIYAKIGIDTRPTHAPANSLVAELSRAGVRTAFVDVPNALARFTGTERTETVEPISSKTDADRLRDTVTAITEGSFGLVFTRFYGVTQPYNELERATAVEDADGARRYMEAVRAEVVKVDGYVKEICEAVPATGKNLIMFIGLQGTNKTLWNIRATTKRNTPEKWTKEDEDRLMRESLKAKDTFLKIMIK